MRCSLFREDIQVFTARLEGLPSIKCRPADRKLQLYRFEGRRFCLSSDDGDSGPAFFYDGAHRLDRRYRFLYI